MPWRAPGEAWPRGLELNLMWSREQEDEGEAWYIYLCRGLTQRTPCISHDTHRRVSRHGHQRRLSSVIMHDTYRPQLVARMRDDEDLAPKLKRLVQQGVRLHAPHNTDVRPPPASVHAGLPVRAALRAAHLPGTACSCLVLQHMGSMRRTLWSDCSVLASME